MNRKVIVRLRGGLGNQLFCYAAGRSLAVRNEAELVLDTVSDFAFDRTYQRRFALDCFAIGGRPATSAERLEPFGYWRRRAARWISKRRAFERRRYVVEDQRGWDERFLRLPNDGVVTLDGYWQSYRYFQSIEGTVRSELRPSIAWDAGSATLPTAPEPSGMTPAPAPSGSPTIAVHYRWFGDQLPDSLENLPLEYYENAVALCEQRFDSPHYLLFSDDADLAKQRLAFLPDKRTTVASAPGADPTGVRELMQMSRCQHFVIANSTFSWWAAWLGSATDKSVFAPNPERLHAKSFWRVPELLPPDWSLL